VKQLSYVESALGSAQVALPPGRSPLKAECGRGMGNPYLSMLEQCCELYGRLPNNAGGKL